LSYEDRKEFLLDDAFKDKGQMNLKSMGYNLCKSFNGITALYVAPDGIYLCYPMRTHTGNILSIINF
jgi:hypothetical protein